MLTKTALTHPAFVANVRRAMRLAGVRAIARGERTTWAHVVNRKGVAVALVVLHLSPAIGGPAFEVIDSADRDITDNVRQAFALGTAIKPKTIV